MCDDKDDGDDGLQGCPDVWGEPHPPHSRACSLDQDQACDTTLANETRVSSQLREPSEGKNLEWGKPAFGMHKFIQSPNFWQGIPPSYVLGAPNSSDLLFYILQREKISNFFQSREREIWAHICVLTYVYNVYLPSRYRIFPPPQKFPSFSFSVKKQKQK